MRGFFGKKQQLGESCTIVHQSGKARNWRKRIFLCFYLFVIWFSQWREMRYKLLIEMWNRGMSQPPYAPMSPFYSPWIEIWFSLKQLLWFKKLVSMNGRSIPSFKNALPVVSLHTNHPDHVFLLVDTGTAVSLISERVLHANASIYSPCSYWQSSVPFFEAVKGEKLSAAAQHRL